MCETWRITQSRFWTLQSAATPKTGKRPTQGGRRERYGDALRRHNTETAARALKNFLGFESALTISSDFRVPCAPFVRSVAITVNAL